MKAARCIYIQSRARVMQKMAKLALSPPTLASPSRGRHDHTNELDEFNNQR